MDQNLIISENYPEDISRLLGGELYLIEESQWYAELPSEGGNKYRFLNLVSHGGNEIFPPGQKDFFFRMSNAIRTDRIEMDADGFALVNVLPFRGLKWNNLQHLFSPKYCILWGVDPSGLDLNCKLWGGLLAGDCRVVYVPSMEEISKDPAMKKQLWALVQRMFGMVSK